MKVVCKGFVTRALADLAGVFRADFFLAWGFFFIWIPPSVVVAGMYVNG
jgi:hypothetical protein